MKKQKNKGITLVALVITIILLLILSGISIATLTGSGLFEKARLAEQKSKVEQEKEESILGDYENKIGEYVGGTRSGNPKTILYPNGGTAENPATITTNQRFEIDNPYPGHRLDLVAEIYYNDVWGDPGFIFSAYEKGGHGVKATQIQGENIDKIIVQTGYNGLMANSYNSGNGFNLTGNEIITSAPFRVIAICLD